MWLIEKIKIYFHTRTCIKRQRVVINREIAHAKTMPMAKPPSETEVILMAHQVATTGCVNIGATSEIIRNCFEGHPELYLKHIQYFQNMGTNKK